MTYHDPDLQIPVMLNDNQELFKAMKLDKVKIDDLTQVFIKLFTQSDKYNSEHVVQCLRMLYQSSVAAKAEIESENFQALQEERKLKTEYSYQDAAKELGIGYSTLKGLIGEGKIVPKKYSARNCKITQSEIERYRGANGT